MRKLFKHTWNFSVYLYFRVRIFYRRRKVRFGRWMFRLRYGDKELALMLAEVDQMTQPHLDKIRKVLQEIDDEHDLLVREGKAEPLPFRLSDRDLTIE